MYSKDLCAKIREIYTQHQNYRTVGRILNIPHTTVMRIVKKKPGKQLKKRGPKFRLTKYQELTIKRAIRQANENGTRLSARKIKELATITNVCTEAIRLNVLRLGFEHTNVKQRIKLTREQRELRVALATHWINTNHPWRSTIFSDEKKFNFDGPDSWSTYTDLGRKTRNRRQIVVVV